MFHEKQYLKKPTAFLLGLCFSFWLYAAEPVSTFKNAGRILQVGPTKVLRTVAEAVKVARDGDTIEVDAGDYVGDVVVWDRHKLTVRGVGGQVRILAGGRAAEGKGIWVVRGESLTVENFEFTGTRVGEKNGAGIRFEKGLLVIRNCIFRDNENGILTAGNKASELLIENSEFGNNGSGDGFSHNLYVGTIRKLVVTGSYFHHAKVGHLLKSRAVENHIMYNRLTDEIGGRASYELEFPNGGIAYVVGNIIQQGSQTENLKIVSFGAENYQYPVNQLFLINNTIVDDRPKPGIFLDVKPGNGNVTVKAINNLLVGSGKLESAGPGEYQNNINVDWDQFTQASRQDYRLLASSKLRGKAEKIGEVNGVQLSPDREYVHPRKTRILQGGALSPGALQSAM
jgi:hypothetical protein